MATKNLFEKDFSFLKLIISVFVHFVASITIGPLIVLFVFILWLIAMGQGEEFVGFITKDSLIGYWFVIITLLIFGLVWLNFINNRKDTSLSTIKCHRWWTEFWIYGKQKSKDIIDLPDEAEDHYDVKIVELDKKLPWLMGLLILSVMSFVVSVIIYFTKDSIRSSLPSELVFSEYQWIIGFLFFIILGVISVISTFYVVYRYFFELNKHHFYWKRFWLGFILYSIRKSHSEFNEETGDSEAIKSYVQGFATEYKKIALEIDTIMLDSDISLDQKVWLERKLEELEQSPSVLIPKSLSLIGTFYGFTLLIAGSLGSLIVGPATDLLEFISGFFI